MNGIFPFLKNPRVIILHEILRFKSDHDSFLLAAFKKHFLEGLQFFQRSVFSRHGDIDLHHLRAGNRSNIPYNAFDSLFTRLYV